MIGEALPTDLLGAAAFAHGMEQRDPIGVDDPEDRRRRQESLRPVLMGREETKEPRPLGQAGEQGPRVTYEPAIEGTVPHAFQRMQHPQGDDLTRPEVGFGMFGKARIWSST
jgi:hypothetical protein